MPLLLLRRVSAPLAATLASLLLPLGRGQEWEPSLILASRTGDDTRVLIIEDAMVSCKGQVFKDGKPVKIQTRYDGCGYWSGNCDYGTEGVRTGSPRLNNMGDPKDVIVILTQPQWGAYYHFVIDSLSRLYWVMEQYPEVVKDTNTFFHTGLVTDVGQTWARLVGIETSEEHSRLLDGYWKGKKMYFPPSNKCADMRQGAQPKAITWMRQTLLKNQELMTAGAANVPTKRVVLLVHRDPRKSGRRAILNIIDLQNELAKDVPDWQVEMFSDYPKAPTIVETCVAFRRADLIVGMHGAGFANLICARPGVPVIEFQKTWGGYDYEILTLKLDLPYVGFRTAAGSDNPSMIPPSCLGSALRCALRFINKQDASCANISYYNNGKICNSSWDPFPLPETLPLPPATATATPAVPAAVASSPAAGEAGAPPRTQEGAAAALPPDVAHPPKLVTSAAEALAAQHFQELAAMDYITAVGTAKAGFVAAAAALVCLLVRRSTRGEDAAPHGLKAPAHELATLVGASSQARSKSRMANGA